MTEKKRLLLAIAVALQLPIAYYLNGHDLFVRAKGTGEVYFWTLWFFCIAYMFISFFCDTR
jgi:hypothetical protein